MKTTWQDIFNAFKQKYPRLSLTAVSYRPCDFMTIEVFLSDGQRVLYSGFGGQAKVIS